MRMSTTCSRMSVLPSTVMVASASVCRPHTSTWCVVPHLHQTPPLRVQSDHLLPPRRRAFRTPLGDTVAVRVMHRSSSSACHTVGGRPGRRPPYLRCANVGVRRGRTEGASPSASASARGGSRWPRSRPQMHSRCGRRPHPCSFTPQATGARCHHAPTPLSSLLPARCRGLE
jgi:hypothetical protein